MGRYVDGDGHVWQGSVHCCHECVNWVRGPDEKQGCTRHGLRRQLIEKFGIDHISGENDCPDWRPGN